MSTEERCSALEQEVTRLFPSYEFMPGMMGSASIVIDHVLYLEDFPEIFRLLEKERARRAVEAQ